jgi:hypothetical protein
MRIFERLRERQNQRLNDLEMETGIAPVAVHDGAVDFQPVEAVHLGHLSGTPQPSTSPA